MGLSWIQLPDGHNFALENASGFNVANGALTIYFSNGTSYLFQAGNNGVAAAVLNQIQGVMATPAAFTQIAGLMGIASISPVQFDVTTATVNIYGAGFDPNTAGKLYFDDTQGGIDHNGYYMNCTVVNPNLMTGTFGGVGDGTLSVSNKLVLITYEDTNSVLSNVITGHNPSGTYVTIP